MSSLATATAISMPRFHPALDTKGQLHTAQPSRLLFMPTPTGESRLSRPLNIFVMHASDLLTDHLPHGDGLIAWNFLKGMAERGHNIHVAATHLEIQGKIPENLHIHLMPLRGTRAVRRIDFMIRMRLLFERLQKTVPFDVATQMNPVFTGVSLAMLGAGVPVALGTYVANWPKEELGAAVSRDSVPAKAWIKNTIAFLQQSAADRLFLTVPVATSRLPIPKMMETKVRWVRHGVDSELFQPAEDADSDARIKYEQEHPTALFVANVVKRKGIEPLVRAWAKVHAELPHAVLTVAGDGPDLPFMKQLAAALGVQDSIRFVGGMQQKALPRLFQDHAVYVLPSFGEPYGGTLIEAMSCGRPVVITNAGGLPEMIAAEGGVRVPMRDADALADGLLTMLRDPEMRRRAGRSNRRTITNTMTWNRVLDTLEVHFSEMLTIPLAEAEPVPYSAS